MRPSPALLLAGAGWVQPASPAGTPSPWLQPLAAEAAALERAQTQGGPGAVVATEQTPDFIRLARSKLAIAVDLRSTRWNVLWSGNAPVAVYAAAFSGEIDGQRVALEPAEWAQRVFRDSMGQGEELHQSWRTGGARVERDLRVNDGSAAFTLGKRIINGSDRELALGNAANLELAAQGWWRLGEATDAPATGGVRFSGCRSVPGPRASNPRAPFATAPRAVFPAPRRPDAQPRR